MVERLKKIAEKHDFHIKEVDDTYNLSFDIRNLPLKIIKLTKSDSNFAITAKCTFLWGTSASPSFFSGNTPDQYRCEITCEFTIKSISFNFHVLESSFFRKFRKKINFKIYCKDNLIQKFLSENKSLKTIYSKCNESAELSPSILCVTKEELVVLNINFQTFDTNVHLIDESINFCYQIMEFDKQINSKS